jgi:hypothetical protein
VNTVGGVANNVVGAVGNVAGDVVTTAGSIVNTAANDITGLLTQGGQGQTAGAGGAGAGKDSEFINPKQSGTQRNTYYGTQNQTSDKYSYNGQLPSKAASNFGVAIIAAESTLFVTSTAFLFALVSFFATLGFGVCCGVCELLSILDET